MSRRGVGQIRTLFGLILTPLKGKMRMPKQKRATATVKMTYGEDADLIAWWNSIPRGSRNAVMKDMMRDYIARERGGYRPIFPRNMPQPFDPARFTQVCDDAAWIRAALGDLPGYVERVILHVTASAPGSGAINTNGQAHIGEASDDSVERRTKRMRKATW